MFVYLLPIAAAQTEPISLPAAVEEALAHNPELRGTQIDQRRAEIARAATLGAYEPGFSLSVSTGSSRSPSNSAVDGTTQIISRSSGWSTGIDQLLPSGATASIGWSETWSSTNSANILISPSTVSERLSLSLSQPLLDGIGSPARAARASALASDDAALRSRAAAEQTILSTSAGYWRLVSAQLSAALSRRSEAVAERSLAETEERFKEGFVGTGDVLQVKRALGTARLSVLTADSEVESADAALKRVLGRSIAGLPLAPTDLPSPPAEIPSGEVLLEAARQANNDWLLAKLALQRAEQGARDARNGALPDLGVSGTFGLSGLEERAADARESLLSAENSDYSVSSQLSVPLPGRQIARSLSDAALALDAARLAQQASEQDLALAVLAAVRTAERDGRRVALAAETVEFARAALEADQELLREGKGATRDVILSLEALASAEADELVARIDLQASMLEVKRVAGELVPP